jgi:hypothetical protein
MAERSRMFAGVNSIVRQQLGLEPRENECP